jgi:hypothetical protein
MGRWPALARGRRASSEIAWEDLESLTTGLELMLSMPRSSPRLCPMTSRRLPHRDADWSDLVPGAIALGLGVDILEVVTLHMLGPGRNRRETT